jgi:hypothetical protein
MDWALFTSDQASVIYLSIAMGWILNAQAGRLLGRRRKGRRSQGRTASADVIPFRPDQPLHDPHVQMEAIAQVGFERRRLLNMAEYRVFRALESIVDKEGGGYRLMAQTSLGELIAPASTSGTSKERKAAFASVNSKRLDFAVIDKNGFLHLAIEYQGAGHHQNKAFLRDAVKKEALRRAGVPLLEVSQGMMPSDLAHAVRRFLAVPDRTGT